MEQVCFFMPLGLFFFVSIQESSFLLSVHFFYFKQNKPNLFQNQLKIIYFKHILRHLSHLRQLMTFCLVHSLHWTKFNVHVYHYLIEIKNTI